MGKKSFNPGSLYKTGCFLVLVLAALLSGCGIRPYDYLMPPLQSLAAPFFPTPSRTPTLLVNKLITETARPAPSATFSTVTPIPSHTLEGLPTRAYFTPETGTSAINGAEISLNNLMDEEIMVQLKGEIEKTVYLPQAGLVHIQIPAGTYTFWIIIPGQDSLHGEKTFPSGVSEWVFTRSEDVLSTPTPRWDTATPAFGP